ncbi:MAG: glycosyltransferase [Bacteroidales bacterium]|nr:glycosyltransferase [Bacteroidales bacterium]
MFGNRRNFVIIPNTSHFEPLVPLCELHQNKLNRNSILIIRSIEERARFDLLLQVAEQLREKDYKFTVAGKGPLLEHYQKEIQKRQLKNIEMLGYVSDAELLNLYSNCDIVLMIAEYGEGFGLPVIEGYLFNKPVIASNKCAVPEVIISDAYLFENTVDNIINSLNSTINIHNENYREYYNSKFSNYIVLAKLRNLYFNSIS